MRIQVGVPSGARWRPSALAAASAVLGSLLSPLALLGAAPPAAAATPAAGVTARVSLTSSGAAASGSDAAISGDGRYVAFVSSSTAFGPNPNNRAIVYRRDVVTDTTTAVSVTAAGALPNGSSWSPALSSDGRYVTFVSAASDLVTSDGNNAADVFVRDMSTGTTSRVSVSMSGG